MACVNALHADAFTQIHLFTVFAGGEELPHPLGVFHSVQRFHGGAACPEILAVLVLGVGLLNVGRVLEHNVQKLGGEPGGKDTALEPLLEEHGDAAGVVDVRVRHQHKIYLACVKGQAAVVHLIPALLQAAVDEDLFAVNFQTVAAAGNTLVSAEKTQFHRVSSSLPSVSGDILTL